MEEGHELRVVEPGTTRRAANKSVFVYIRIYHVIPSNIKDQSRGISMIIILKFGVSD
jgi:hypothetical protein